MSNWWSVLTRIYSKSSGAVYPSMLRFVLQHCRNVKDDDSELP
jgi:hypothetical protein